MKKYSEITIAIVLFLLLSRRAPSTNATAANPNAQNSGIFPFLNLGLDPLQQLALTQQAQQISAAGGDVVFQQMPANVVVDEGGELATINSTGGTTVLPDPNGIGGGFAT
jgi:hypothetical protein